eukprot:scaffold269085_cov30-Tisochrysis_lutea.AAC.3
MPAFLRSVGVHRITSSKGMPPYSSRCSCTSSSAISAKSAWRSSVCSAAAVSDEKVSRLSRPAAAVCSRPATPEAPGLLLETKRWCDFSHASGGIGVRSSSAGMKMGRSAPGACQAFSSCSTSIRIEQI